MEKGRFGEWWWAGRRSSDPRPPSPELAVQRSPGPRGTDEVPVRVSFSGVIEVQATLPFPCGSISPLSQRCLPHFWKQQGRQVSWKEARGEEKSYWMWNLVCPWWQSQPPFHLQHILQRSAKVPLGVRTARRKELGYCCIIFSDTAPSIQPFAEK